MAYYYRATFIGLFLLSQYVPAVGQSASTQPPPDFQTWYDASLKLNMKKGWEVTTQYRVRFYNNAHDYRGSYFFLTGEKKVNKYMNVLANYRLSLIENQAYHRFAVGFNAHIQAGRWRPFLRPTLQNQRQYFQGDDENSGDGKTYLRTRVGTKYHINKLLDAYLYAEPFFNTEKQGLPIAFWQNSAGLSVDVSKRISLTTYYIWQPELQIKHAQTKHIVGLSLNVELKTGNQTKKEKKPKSIPQF
ncbi:hypothetical protein GCM10027592_30840 [Spirosoma flavus]